MGKKLIPIYVLEILKRYSTKQKTLTQAEILHYLDKDYNIEITRNTLSTLLDELRDDDYVRGRRGVYYENPFSVQELRLLIDGVLYGQHIPEEEAGIIIEKLKELSPVELKEKVKNVIYLQDMNHTSNTMLYGILDRIDEAIERNRNIEIGRCYYEADGKLHLTKTKVVSPYYLVTDKNRYYLICYDEERKELVNLRIDRIQSVSILEQSGKKIHTISKYKDGFNLAEYMIEHAYMFSGDCEYIYLKLKADNIGDFIDWFGTDYRILEKNEDRLVLRFKTNLNAMYYWALQYGSVAEVLKPEKLRARLQEGIEEMAKKYEG